MKISLAVIVKDQKEDIERIINDYSQYFDELVFLVDDEKAHEGIAEDDKVKFHLYKRSEEEEKLEHIFFDRKRNELTKLLTGDYYFRLDTDDNIINPENIRPITQKASYQGINIVYCWYEYAKDKYGNVHAAHYRETIVKVSDDLYWNKRIHENILPGNTSTHKYVIEDSIKIEHILTVEGALNSHQRNLKYLIEEYMENKENCDPRTLAYLGRMLFEKDPEKSRFFLEQHIAKSGWDEDRYMSWCLLAEVMSKQGEYKDAIGCCHEAMAERPDYPDAYLKLHSVYMDMEDWPKAIIWGNIGLQTPVPRTFMLTDPSSYSWRPMLSMAYAYYQTGKFEDAWRLFGTVKQQVPGGELIEKSEQLFGEAVARKKFTDHFMWLFEFLRGKDQKKTIALFDAIPAEYNDHEGLMSLRAAVTPAKTWSDKSVVFYCGKTPANWADPSVLKGIGGSEEGVIYLSRELTKLGYEVTVFCKCGNLEGKYNGVTYINTYKFNPKDTYNSFFAWRANIFQLADIKAKKKFVWIHDVPQSDQFDKGKYNFDKVIVLSEYHKSLLPDHIPEDKIFVSTNGLNVEDFKGIDNIQRQKNRLIYASSYDRGLEKLLQGWSKIRAEVPDAEIHIFYGWNTYKELMKISGSNRNSDFVDHMEKLMDQPGVFEHGRVGHKELLKEYARSHIFAYPCNFIGEINCIALTKAIACGCTAVTNDFAVMKERNPQVVCTEDKFIDGVIETLKNPPVIAVPTTYIEDNSWATVAQDWSNNLIKAPVTLAKFNSIEEYKDVYKIGGVHRFVDDSGNAHIQKRFSKVKDLIDKHKLKSMLDVGCADGTLCIYIKEMCGVDTHGVDISRESIEYARKQAEVNKVDIDFDECLIEEYEKDKKYDVVVSLETLEHVYDPKAFLEKLESLTNPEGYVVLSTPDREGEGGLSDPYKYHINNYNKDELENFVGKDRIVLSEKHEGEDLFIIYKINKQRSIKEPIPV